VAVAELGRSVFPAGPSAGSRPLFGDCPRRARLVLEAECSPGPGHRFADRIGDCRFICGVGLGLSMGRDAGGVPRVS